MLKIKKLDEEITYRKITTTYTFDVGGKEVRAYEHTSYDGYDDDYDLELDENDEEKLTEEERDLLNDEIDDLKNEKDGTEIELETEADLCSVENCGELKAVGGMCAEHYQKANAKK